MPPDDDSLNAEDLVEEIESEAENSGKLTIGEIVRVAGTRAYGPMLLIPGVIAISPLGAIPGMSILTGSLIVLVAAQLVFGRGEPWLPAFLLGITVPGKRVAKSARKMEKPARYVDRALHARLVALCEPPLAALPALACILLAATFYPLALVPFGVTGPSAAVIVLALGFTLRDGLLTLVGLAGAVAAAGLIAWLFLI